MCFVHGQRNSGVLHHGDDSGFAPIPSDTDQMCVVFPCLGADWQSVKTGTSLEWVNFADGEWMSLKILWMNFIQTPLYDQNILYHSMWKWKLAGTSMALAWIISGCFFFNLKDFLEMIIQNFIFEAYIWTERLSSSFAELTKNRWS